MTEPITNEPRRKTEPVKPIPEVIKSAVETPEIQVPQLNPEDKQKLAKLSNEISSQSEQEQKENTEQLPVKSSNVDKKTTNPIKSFFNWLKYTPTNDNYKINTKVFMPAFAGTIVSSLGIFATTLPVFSEFVASHPTMAGNLILGSLSLLVPSGVTMLGSVALIERIKSREIKNRMPFSRLLTVSKVFTAEKSTLTPAFKQLDADFKSGFTGELHFVGINRASWEGITNPLATLKEGFVGLNNLAKACEQQDPKLQDINFFGGISPIVSTSLEKFGFKILPMNEVDKPSVMGKVMHFMAMLRGEDRTYPSGHKARDDEARVGVISRHDLILHKDDFAKEAERIESLEKRRYGTKTSQENLVPSTT